VPAEPFSLGNYTGFRLVWKLVTRL
jgi:hypothetical protein